MAISGEKTCGDEVQRDRGGYYSQFIPRPLSLVYFVASVLKGILAAAAADRYLGERASAFCLAPAFLAIRHDSSYNNPLSLFLSKLPIDFLLAFHDDPVY